MLNKTKQIIIDALPFFCLSAILLGFAVTAAYLYWPVAEKLVKTPYVQKPDPYKVCHIKGDVVKIGSCGNNRDFLVKSFYIVRNNYDLENMGLKHQILYYSTDTAYGLYYIGHVRAPNVKNIEDDSEWCNILYAVSASHIKDKK